MSVHRLAVLVSLFFTTFIGAGAFSVIRTPAVGCLSSIRLASSVDGDYADDDDDDELEYLTPSQVKLLRKEASKRQSRRSLPRVPLYQQEDDSENLSAISDALEQHELVQVSGLGRKSGPKEVKAVSEDLEWDLMEMMEKEVFVVTLKGGTATLYSPYRDDDELDNNNHAEKRIQLRNSYRPNQWSKRIKAPRDHRGQIIKEVAGAAATEQ